MIRNTPWLCEQIDAAKASLKAFDFVAADRIRTRVYASGILNSWFAADFIGLEMARVRAELRGRKAEGLRMSAATVSAMQRALMDLDYCRIGSARERASAYAAAGIDRDEAFQWDAEAWRTERVRRRMMAAQVVILEAAQ